MPGMEPKDLRHARQAFYDLSDFSLVILLVFETGSH
jgi:hypothetical protein